MTYSFFFLHIIVIYVIYFSVNIQNYQILKSIGKGGMGEVFLARDPICGRNVALKVMREEWKDSPVMRRRFLREAQIAAKLSHPSIIPIHSIEESLYTMPFIEGETLKEILKKTREQSKDGTPLHPIGSSVPALVRIFLSICGAVAYAHSHGILHRDLKPENIIVGKFGEVIILDWGLADFIDRPERNNQLDLKEESPSLTQPGKIPGTLLYMAPERAFGAKSSIQTDIYSMGVILYQILTLHFPFHRKSVKEFRKMHEYEKILPPEELAPDREISPHLSSIVFQCLEKSPKKRFKTMLELMRELENYIEGIPEWQKGAELFLDRKKDWLIQENIALAKHRALTRGIESVEWVNLMISKGQYPGNISIETTLAISEQNQGVGILFCIPEADLPTAVDEAFCMWFSDHGLRLYRSNVEVLRADHIILEKGRPYHVRITHVDNHIRLFLDGIQQVAFHSVIPLAGSRVGLLLRDGFYSIDSLRVSVGSQSIMVNCLAIPDAFLARGNFEDALQEYRKISHSFPGRAEGREATFLAGMTLLKKGKMQKVKQKREELFAGAFSEFEKLHNTAGGPLEYLGKSKIYKAQKEFREEAKCLELALRKYPHHPLRPILIENILTRLHESSQTNRLVAYHFALIVLRHLDHLPDAKAFAQLLESHLELLPFFKQGGDQRLCLIIQLAFWLDLPSVLMELIEREGLDEINLQNAHIALLLLGDDQIGDLSYLEKKEKEVIFARFEYALIRGNTLPNEPYPLWKALKEKEWDNAKRIVSSLRDEDLYDETKVQFFLYGCFLAKTEGEEAAIHHLINVSEKPFPPTTTLLSHYLKGRISLKNGWIETALPFEKVSLMQQLELFSLCIGDQKFFKNVKRLKES